MVWMLLTGCSSAEPPELASVMLSSGKAEVIHEGERIPAEIGTLVHPGDTLATGIDGAIILHLHNDHLVRIDADLELPVASLLLLRAPKSTVSPGDQLAQFVYPEERETLEGLDRAERVAGWHARLTAAESFGARGANEFGIDGEAESATVKRAPEDSPSAGGPPMQSSPAPRPEPAKARPFAHPPPPPAPPPAEPPASITTGDLPILQAELQRCVSDWADGFPLSLDRTLSFQLQVVDGVIVAVAAPGGLFAPDCLRDALVDRPTDLTDDTELRIERK